MNTSHDTPGNHVSSTLPDETIQAIAHALSGLRFGQVTVIVQDGRVMQIDRTERRRITPLDP